MGMIGAGLFRVVAKIKKVNRSISTKKASVLLLCGNGMLHQPATIE